MSTEPCQDWKMLPHAPVAGAELGRLLDVPDGGVQFYSFGPAESAFRLLVVRSGEAVFAYVNRCAHFGVPLAAKVEQLKFKPHVSVSCNVHYARFRWQDGYCEMGDCEGESLLAVPVQIRDGSIYIAT